MEFSRFVMIYGGLLISLSKLLQLEHMVRNALAGTILRLSNRACAHHQRTDAHLKEGAVDEAIPKGQENQGLDDDQVRGLPDRRISEIARQVEPVEVANAQAQANGDVLLAAIGAHDSFDATNVPFVGDKTVFTERREFERLNPASDACFRL
ncbi:hypothetical protein GN958_ATG05921 [Phytophthora infestans]|uniref:Uncharacterized protein n=1 Tax=Phytophthora infestans TaxID=4787 RepID=A0A8S9UX02_PHYIN|nr:hypothetical protein GN958_ATG05921 [Phytophthora infestans]